MWTYHEGLGVATYYTNRSTWIAEYAGEDYYVVPCAASIGGTLHVGHALVALSFGGAVCPMLIATWFGPGEPNWVHTVWQKSFPYFARDTLDVAGQVVGELYQNA